VEVEEKKAIVCLVGENIRGKVGVAANVFGAIAGGEVNIHMISQGASEINISLVVEESDVPSAVKLLHRRFFETKANGRARRNASPADSLLFAENGGLSAVARCCE
jgi:predicted amino acid-binding ACT domain protein